MADPPRRRFDKARFARVLERATELDAEHGDSLTEEDLREAGRELELSDASIEAALREEEQRNARALTTRQHPRPFDTRVTLDESPGALRLTIPAEGLTASTAGLALFNAFWLAFITAWTVGAAHASPLFACFSIPFWLAGFGMMATWVKRAWQVDELHLTAGHGELRSRLGPLRWKRTLDPQHLQSTWRGHATTGAGRRQRTEPAHLRLEYGVTTLQLMAGRSEAELRWADEALRLWLDEQRRDEPS